MLAIVNSESLHVKNKTYTRIFPVQEIIFDHERLELILFYDRYIHYVFSLSGIPINNVVCWLKSCAQDGLIDTSSLVLLYVTGYED